jgi:hypothetical protein
VTRSCRCLCAFSCAASRLPCVFLIPPTEGCPCGTFEARRSRMCSIPPHATCTTPANTAPCLRHHLRAPWHRSMPGLRAPQHALPTQVTGTLADLRIRGLVVTRAPSLSLKHPSRCLAPSPPLSAPPLLQPSSLPASNSRPCRPVACPISCQQTPAGLSIPNAADRGSGWAMATMGGNTAALAGRLRRSMPTASGRQAHLLEGAPGLL